MKDLPLISCLCVTRNKVHLIARSIECFKAQTYPNKELILVYEDCDSFIRDFAAQIDDPEIVVSEVSTNPKMSLGALRNWSLDIAKGEYFCQWDADDWFHTRRLEEQYLSLKKMCKSVCFLTYWIIYDSLTKKAYLSRKRIWEGSILCSKEKITSANLAYPSIPKLEDFQFVEKLLESNHIYPLDMPHLYIYVYHGDNTWNYSHFQGNFRTGKAMSEEANTIVTDILEGKYTPEKASELMESPTILEALEFDYQFY